MEFFIIYTDTCQVSTSNDLLHSTVYHSHLLGVASVILALFPGTEDEEEEEKAPGTHCLCMLLITTEFRADCVNMCTYVNL